MPKKLFFVAGEPSGDLHGARLINSLLSIEPDIQMFGIGGQQMKKAGAEIFEDLTEIAVVGFVEVVKNIRRFKMAFGLTLKKIDQIRPDAVILIDYPGFNLRIAAQIKKRNIPIIYYVSPQVWAWGEKRIDFIKKTVDFIVVVFKFEEDLYKKHGMRVFFSGHPLIDIVTATDYRENILKEHGLDKSKKIIALLPGSRINEVNSILPIMLQSASLIHNQNRGTQFLILKSPALQSAVYEKMMKAACLPARLIENERYNLLSVCDFAMVCSGTATLETAILRVPMAIIYKMSFLSWLVIKNIIKIPYIGLVNIVAGKIIVPEFIQYNAKPHKISAYVSGTLNNKKKLDEIRSDLGRVINLLGEAGAGRRAAECVLKILSDSKG